MSNNKSLPTFIEVANIRNLFWNNNSDLYPTCIPSTYYRIDKTRPVFYSPYVGTCILTGEFNHCIYNGTYYFLTKLEVLDIPSKRYKYQLDYDVMMNFMNAGVEVNGTLIRTNREDILEECLQTTKPILADPIRKVAYSYKKSDKWQDKVTLKIYEVNDVLARQHPWGITREAFNVFVSRVENNPIAKGTKNKEWLANKKEFNIYSHQDPLVVLERMNYTENIKDPWRERLLWDLKLWLAKQKVNNFKDLVIVKQSTPTDHFNNGGYVVGERDKTLGSNIVSEVSLSTIDLSGLLYIQPIDNRTKKNKPPNKTPSYNLLPHVADINKFVISDGVLVLLRRPYLPIANEKTSDGAITHITGTDNFSQLGTWPGIDAPQKITTKSGETGYLWHLDKNNLAILGGRIGRLTHTKSNVNMSVYNDEYSRWAFFNTTYKNLAPLGLLMFQLKKSHTEWDDLTVIADSIDTLWVRVGLSTKKMISKYLEPESDYWWANVDKEMEDLWGNRLFARLHLDLDQFNWLSIAPSYEKMRYKYYYGNYWGYQKFFPHAGNRELWYPSRLNRMNIKWKGKEIDNPYAHIDPNVALPQWLIERQKKIDDISIYKHIPNIFGDPHPFNLKKGDIVFSSYEYNFVKPSDKSSWLRWHLPYSISKDEWKKWAIESHNVHLKDSIVKANSLEEDNDDMRKSKEIQDTIKDVLTGISVAAGVITAPFTGGATLIPAVTALAGHHISSADEMATLTKEELAVMVNIEPYSTKTNVPIRSGIIFYLYRGEYRIGVIDSLYTDMKVSNDEDNLVSEVNGTKTSDGRIFVIRPITDKIDFNNNPALSENDKLSILKHGYGDYFDDQMWVKLTQRDKIHYYSEEDLKVGTNTFDLKGTNWYLVVHNGQYNLIPKSESVFNTIKDEGQQIEIEGDVPIEAKINQKAYLNFHGQVFPLNTKFSFHKQIFTYKSRPLKIDQKYADPDVEYKWLQVNSTTDDIDVLVTLPRKESRAAEKVDSSQVLMMKERLLQLTTNYEQDKYANELMMDDKRLYMARQREDLDSQWWSSVVGIGGKAATFAASAGIGIASGGAGAIAGAAGLGALGALGSMKSDIEFLIKYPTLMKRVSEDERNLLLANSQALYQRKQNYEHDFKYQTFKLNKIAGSYQKAGVSNRDAQDQYVKERKVSDVFVEVLLPSDDQLLMANRIFNVFGCECVSDKFEVIPLSIRNDMHPGIYKFSRIEDGIRSNINDSTLRDILKQILENGVKFQECYFEIDPLDLPEEKPKTPIIISPHPEIDPTKIVEWPKELWDIYRNQKSEDEIIKDIKKAKHYGLTDQEWEKYKDQIRTTSDKELLEDVSRIIAARDGGTTVIIGSLPQEPDELQKQIDSLTARNNELQAKKEELEAQLAQCEQEKGDKHKDKEDLQQKLNEAQAEIDQVKKQLSDLQTEKQEVDRELADCRQNIETYSQDIESLNEQLRKCKVDLDNAVKAQETVGTVNTAEIKTLRAKVKELEATIASKTAELDSLKKECDDDKKKLADEIQSHKEDKEEMTQKLNDERRLVLNKTDEVNRLTKEKENLENQKFDIERQLRECLDGKTKVQEELERTKTRLTAAQERIEKLKKRPGKAPLIDNECGLMKEVLNDPYDIDVKNREGGLSRFIDLIVLVADAIKWMRRSGLDAILMRNETMRPIIQKLEAFEQIPIVDKIEDITRDPKWDKFLAEITKKNLHNHPDQDVRAIYDKMREVVAMQKPYVVHGVKAALDDLNYLTYKAKETLAEELKTDTNLQQFFKHTYPGNTPPVYAEVFGRAENSIIRKRFTNDVQCKPEGGDESSLQIIDRFNKETSHTTETVPTPKDIPTFKGIPLTRNKRFFIQPFNWFRDAKNPLGVGTFTVGTEPNGIPRNGFEAYNYPYTITDSKNPNKKNAHGVFVYFYNQWGQYNSAYVIKETAYAAAVRDAALHLWRNREKAQIPESFLRKFRDDNKDFGFLLELQGLQQHGVYQRTRIPIVGMNSIVKGLGKYSRDLIALLYIITRCGFSVSKWESGTDNKGYNVINTATRWTTDWSNINIYEGTGNMITFVSTWIMPTEYIDDLKNNLDPRLGTGNITNREAAMYRLVSWLYAVVSQPDQAEELIGMMYDTRSPFGKFVNFRARP